MSRAFPAVGPRAAPILAQLAPGPAPEAGPGPGAAGLPGRGRTAGRAGAVGGRTDGRTVAAALFLSHCSHD